MVTGRTRYYFAYAARSQVIIGTFSVPTDGRNIHRPLSNDCKQIDRFIKFPLSKRFPNGSIIKTVIQNRDVFNISYFMISYPITYSFSVVNLIVNIRCVLLCEIKCTVLNLLTPQLHALQELLLLHFRALKTVYLVTPR